MVDDVLIFSDAHIHPHQKSHQRLEDGLTAFQWVFETARKNQVTKVIFCGDLFHSREKLEIYAYHSVYKAIRENYDIHVYLLLGNHDLWLYEKTDISSVEPLESLPNVTVIAKPSSITINGEQADFIPFTHDPVSVIKGMKPGKFLFGHIAVDDAVLNKRHQTTSDVSVESDGEMVKVSKTLFEPWDMAFFGHYHLPQMLSGNAEYVGSLLPLDFGDANHDKHVIVLNFKTMVKRYVVNDFSPKFHVIKADDLNEGFKETGFFKIEVADGVQAVEIREKLKNVRKVEFTRKTTEKPENVSVQHDFDSAEGDVLQRFVTSKKAEIASKNLDQDYLLRIGQSLCKGDGV